MTATFKTRALDVACPSCGAGERESCLGLDNQIHLGRSKLAAATTRRANKISRESARE